MDVADEVVVVVAEVAGEVIERKPRTRPNLMPLNPSLLANLRRGTSASAILSQTVDLTWVYGGQVCQRLRRRRRSRPTSHSVLEVEIWG